MLPTEEQAREFDPTGKSPSDPGAKLDAGKIRMGLLKRFGLALISVGDLATTGALCYSDNGWAEVPNGISRYEDALIGHLFKEAFESEDPGTGTRHEVAVAWNALARLQLLIEADEAWKSRLLKRKSTASITRELNYGEDEL